MPAYCDHANRSAVTSAGDRLDNAGPFLSMMLNLIPMISLMLAPVLMRFGGLIQQI